MDAQALMPGTDRRLFDGLDGQAGISAWRVLSGARLAFLARIPHAWLQPFPNPCAQECGIFPDV
jgi:hypothetical protein